LAGVQGLQLLKAEGGRHLLLLLLLRCAGAVKAPL
jgi:hypothetical protein